MPRLFTALEVPGHICQRMALLRGGIPNARWIDVENYHITLRFIGDVDDAFARDAANALSMISRSEITITLDQLDFLAAISREQLLLRFAPIKPCWNYRRSRSDCCVG